MTGRHGVCSAYGTLRRVIVHRPGVELDAVTADTLEEFNFARPVDRARFVTEYDAMVDCLTRHGAEAVLLNPHVNVLFGCYKGCDPHLVKVAQRSYPDQFFFVQLYNTV